MQKQWKPLLTTNGGQWQLRYKRERAPTRCERAHALLRCLPSFPLFSGYRGSGRTALSSRQARPGRAAGRGRAGSLPPAVGSESEVGTESVEEAVSRQRNESEGWLGGAGHLVSFEAVNGKQSRACGTHRYCFISDLCRKIRR